jgi:hypothetical protein
MAKMVHALDRAATVIGNYSMYIPGIYLDGLRKVTKFLQQVRWFADRD